MTDIVTYPDVFLRTVSSPVKFPLDDKTERLIKWMIKIQAKHPTSILYTFRRCPYVMRARLALFSAKVPFVLREISLKNKPLQLTAISKKATVPCLNTPGRVITESLEIMYWALNQNDPESLLNISPSDLNIIKFNDESSKIRF